MALPSLNHANHGNGLLVALHEKLTLVSPSSTVLFCGVILNSGGPGKKGINIIIIWLELDC